MRVVDRAMTAHARPGALLVFPSEVAAEWWRARLAREMPSRVVRTDRIISWDVFKQRVLPVQRVDRPASHIVRLIFARATLEENAREPFLSVVVEPEFAADSLNAAAAVARMVPSLPILERGRAGLRPVLAADVAHLLRRYREFLAQYDFFEPGWELRRAGRPVACPPGTTLFWPELLDDWEELRDLVEPAVEVDSIPDTPVAEQRRFDTAEHEVAAALDTIEQALDSGVAAHEIAVTVGDLAALRPTLELNAARRSIPLRFAAGRPLAELPGGTIFARIDDVLSSDFSAPALAALLRDRSIPWREAERSELVCRFAFAAHCYSSAQWDVALELADAAVEDTAAGGARATERPPFSAAQVRVIGGRYRALRAGLQQARAARSVADLRRALRRFLDGMVAAAGDPAWREPGLTAVEPVYERALSELRGLELLEARGLPVGDPWSFFLELLRERSYVAAGGTDSVSVYPYRVAAGIPARLHCVIDLSQRATRVRDARPVGVRSDELRRLEWRERDRSAAYFAAYASLVEGTHLSCADRSVDGAQIPAPEFAPQTSTIGAVPGDTFAAERSWWAGQATFPDRVTRSQRDGFRAATATALAPRRTDLTEVLLADDRLRSMLSAGRRHWSASSLKKLIACPFSFLIRRQLGVESLSTGFDAANRMHLGSVLHDALRRTVDELAMVGSAARESIPAVVSRQLEAAFQRPEVRLLLPRIALEEIVDGFRTSLASVLTQVMPPPDAVSPAVETELEVSAEASGVTLTGRIDLLIRYTAADGLRVAVFDHKLSAAAAAKTSDVIGGDGRFDRVNEPQLLLYAWLVRRRDGQEPDLLAYTDLTGGSVTATLARDGAHARAHGHEIMRALLPEVPGWVAAAEAQLAGGDFRCRSRGECGSCGIRTICRRCYAVRTEGQ